MPLLFSYGTLQREEVQRALFGRRLEGRADRLLGYRLATLAIEDASFVATSGAAVHAVVQLTGSDRDAVDGVRLELSEAELDCADRDEPTGYRRVEAALASGHRAWVYVDARLAGERV